MSDGVAVFTGYCLAVEAAILSAYPNPFTVGVTVFVACLFIVTLTEWKRS